MDQFENVTMRSDKENLIVKLTFEFSLEIIKFSEEIRALHRYEMASQVFRSGTSIGANIREAQNAESKADFIHKLKFQRKKLMNWSIGYYYVNNQNFTQAQKRSY